jgi:hypothetical protein
MICARGALCAGGLTVSRVRPVGIIGAVGSRCLRSRDYRQKAGVRPVAKRGLRTRRRPLPRKYLLWSRPQAGHQARDARSMDIGAAGAQGRHALSQRAGRSAGAMVMRVNRILHRIALWAWVVLLSFALALEALAGPPISLPSCWAPATVLGLMLITAARERH